MKQQLTVKQAREQGYVYALYADERYQSLMGIERDIDTEYINWNREVELCEKESYGPSGISAEDLAELVAEHVECQNADETGDDTNEVYEIIKKLDFSDMAEKINTAINDGRHYYRSSGIKLIKE